MKLFLKTVAVTAILAMTTASAFAVDATGPVVAATGVDFDTSNIAQTGDLDTVHTLSIAEMVIAFGASSAVQNVGLVSQTGDFNIAYISQLGAGNFTAIIQDATSASVANVGYVFQAGNTNRAVIMQR
jgi:hypothetical protein